jgi:glycosyltransferase involved in cell wall biosynthesis
MASERVPRVLFVGLSAMGHGGIQSFNRRLSGALAQLPMEAGVIMYADSEGEDETVALCRSFLGLLRAVLSRARSTDVLLLGHINLLPIAALYRMLRPRGRVILFAHGIEVWGDPAYRPARARDTLLLRRLVDQIAIVSRYSRNRMMQAFDIADASFTHFPNAVDLPSTPVGPKQGSTILSVSRLGAGEHEKNIHRLIEAMPRVLAEVPAARLRVVGEGALRGRLQSLAKELGVGDCVTLSGAVDAAGLADAFNDAAVFCLPSSKEGFGIVFLEAWVAGVPVVGSRFGAAPDVIENGADGLTVDPHDVPALADALVTLLRDSDLAARMATAGHEKVARLYSAEAFVANLGALLGADARGTLR